MNIFKAFADIRNSKTELWVETTATFTGNRNKAFGRTKTGYYELDYYEYEITYSADDKLRKGFYKFYPLPDPEPEEIKDKTMRIKYNPKKPYMFEPAFDNE